MRGSNHLDVPLIRAYEGRIASSAAHHESLSALPPAKLRKFENGRALPFNGYSLVQWIDSCHELWHKLSDSCELLRGDFTRERIEQYFYFLPATTFHATVRDLMLGQPMNEDRYIQAVRSAFNRLVGRRNRPPEMDAEGISFIGESSIAVILNPVDRESLSTLVEIRQVVAEELKRRNEMLTELDAADFFGHISLVYAVAGLPAEIYGRAKDLVRAQSQRAGLIGDLAFDVVELRRFDSMANWSEPLETLRFGGPDG